MTREMVLRPKRAKNGTTLRYFLAAIEEETDKCIEWPFASLKTGYGHVTTGSKTTLVSRLTLFCTVGSPQGAAKYAAHSCRSTACFNPRHLRWATQKENMADKVGHGTTNHGEKNGGCKLTARQALTIRDSKATGAALSAKYGISPSMVSNIKRGKAWASLGPQNA